MIKHLYCFIILLTIGCIGIETYYCLTGQVPDVIPTGLLPRFVFYYSYFTVLSSLAFSFGSLIVLIKPQYHSTAISVLRVNGVVGIVITGLVYNVMLRSLYHPNNLTLRITTECLHVVIPMLGVIGWLCFEQHHRLTKKAMGYAVIPPIVYIIYIFIRGSLTGFYPYPILNVDLIGYRQVLINIAVMAVMFLFFMMLMYIADNCWFARSQAQQE